MVETLWWQFGGFQRMPPHNRDQVGEGWLVLASPEAIEVLTAEFGSLFQRMKVERSERRDGEERTTERFLNRAIGSD